MGISEVFNNFMGRWAERKRKRKEYEEDDRLREKVAERKLSHNERIFDGLLEEERQENIKEQLNQIMAQRKMEEKQKAQELLKFNGGMFKEKNILQEPCIFFKKGEM